MLNGNKYLNPISVFNLRQNIMDKLRVRQEADKDDLISQEIAGYFLKYGYSVIQLRELLDQLDRDNQVDAIARVAVKRVLKELVK